MVEARGVEPLSENRRPSGLHAYPLNLMSRTARPKAGSTRPPSTFYLVPTPVALAGTIPHCIASDEAPQESPPPDVSVRLSR